LGDFCVEGEGGEPKKILSYLNPRRKCDPSSQGKRKKPSAEPETIGGKDKGILNDGEAGRRKTAQDYKKARDIKRVSDERETPPITGKRSTSPGPWTQGRAESGKKKPSGGR